MLLHPIRAAQEVGVKPARWRESGRLVDSASSTKLNRTGNDETFDLKTNVLIWGLFKSTTMESAMNLGLEYGKNLVACQNHNFGGINDCGKFIQNSESVYDDV